MPVLPVAAHVQRDDVRLPRRSINTPRAFPSAASSSKKRSAFPTETFTGKPACPQVPHHVCRKSYCTCYVNGMPCSSMRLRGLSQRARLGHTDSETEAKAVPSFAATAQRRHAGRAIARFNRGLHRGPLCGCKDRANVLEADTGSVPDPVPVPSVAERPVRCNCAVKVLIGTACVFPCCASAPTHVDAVILYIKCHVILPRGSRPTCV